MKHYILLLTALFAIPGSLPAMEKEAKIQRIKIDKSKVTYNYEARSFLDSVPDNLADYVITAFYQQYQKVGKVIYRSHYDHENCDRNDFSKCHEYPKCWEITYLLIEPQYRNNGIGFELFKRCVDDVCKKNCKTLIWDARPFGQERVSIDELIAVYEKMIKELNKKEPKKAELLKAQKDPTGDYAVMAIGLT